MEISRKKRLVRAADELKKFLESSPDYRTHVVDRAFVYWYLAARFGDEPNTKHKVTDGESDGGIDAIASSDTGIYVLQMKYETRPRLSNLTRNDVVGFEKIKFLFVNASDNEFSEWLKTVRNDLIATYNKLRQDIKRKHVPARFLLVTSKKSTFDVTSDGVEIDDYRKVLPLWELYQEGFTPPIESISFTLRAQMTEDVRGRFTTYVGLADIKEFRTAMSKDKNERLFAQNVRTHLRSAVNESIKETYEKEPDKFWLGNNGIYIVCRDVSISGSTVKLIYPSIINGSQTLHSVNQSKVNHTCHILVRILKLSEHDQKLLSQIIRRTNSQNAMNLVNLWAHDPYQLNIARFLYRYHVFYERREKEWRNEKRELLDGYVPVTVKEVAQWVSVLHRDIGMGPARTNVASLFEEDGNYSQIFEDFDKKFVSHRYKDLLLLVWAGLFVRHIMKDLGQRNRSRAKIAHLFVTKFVYEAIYSIPNSHVIFGQKLREGSIGRRFVPKRILSIVNSVINGIVVIQNREQSKNEKLDFSNFFKRKDLPEEAYAKIVTPAVLKKISRLIFINIDKIY